VEGHAALSPGVEALSERSTFIAASIAKPSAGITLAMGTVAVMELMRDATVIRLFGAGAVSDAYFLGIALPMMVGGAFKSIGVQVVMPWFCLSVAGDADTSRVRMSQMFFLLLLPALLLGLASRHLAVPVARVIGGPAIHLEMLVTVLGLALPSLGLMAASAVVAAYLNARERYSAVAWSRFINSTCFILAILLRTSGREASSLGLAYLAGNTVELGWLAWLARPSMRCLVSKKGITEWPALGKLFGSTVLPSMTFVLCALGTAAERVLAGYLTVGSVATLSYGRRATLALGRIFAQGMNTVVRSKASKAHADGGQEETAAVISQGFRLLLLVLVPIAVLVIVLRVPITRLLFASKQFETGEVPRTAAVIASFAAALPAHSLISLFLTPFYAQGDTETPSVHRLLLLAINLALDLAAVRYLGVLGIALAYLVTSTLSAGWLAERRVTKLQVWRDVGFFARLVIGGLGAGITFWVVFHYVDHLVPAGTLGVLWAVAVSTLAGEVAFVLAATLLGIRELRLGIQWLLHVIGRSTAV
jgi:putative peptidoglycan lipid II flippase